jgi:glycosyltransferase involved in cell wall biosynthesis
MRILILHSPYLSGSVSGENRVVEDEVRLLRDAGHDVLPYLAERRTEGGMGSLREGFSAIWSREATRDVRGLLRDHRPDVVHCHNLFPGLSPAVVRLVRDTSSALVMTLHNFRLLCLPATLLRDGKVCEECLGKLPWRGVVHRCYRDSAAGSSALATSIGIHRALGTFDAVDLYLAVSDFVGAKHIEAGLGVDRVITKSNFAWPAERRRGPGDYFLFAGRLAREKGVRILIDAWQALEARLVVVGDGPEAQTLRRMAPDSVEFRSPVSPDEMPRLLAGARGLVLPSVWYEGAPRSILEAYAAGVPVLASSVGGLPEMVTDAVTGLLFPPENSRALAAAAERLCDDGESARLGEGAWTAWSERFTPGRALENLEHAYRTACSRAQSLHSA